MSANTNLFTNISKYLCRF